ncbi:SRPBCC family protein [Nocardia sp. NBC_00508]|uniref:SRPBCC family protein n=1 Tax=Nocardia sp. NBC_00508 TaxID=2975992 RepID=UPI002E7FFBEF|nr:SRPBCC family protein [Nocardia sp. NBC_00508]WUD63561.1 SRPBCC family protein [Nocardia sp. NBC_00508]
MRTKTDIRFFVDTDPEQVMDALIAVESLPEWSSSYSDVRVATRDRRRRPRRVFVRAELLGSSDLQVLEYDWTDDRASWIVTDSTRGVRGGGWFEVSYSGDGTHVQYHVELYLPIPVPGFLLKRTVRKANEVVVECFIEFAERFPESETYQHI